VNAKKLLQRADQIQQGRPWLAFGIAAWKKFGDDQAGNLAALVAYYAFFSIFPLLLVLDTVLQLVLRGDPALQHKLLNSALSQYPIIGNQLHKHVHTLSGTGIALVIGLIGTFYGARGVASAIQNALNTAWEVPFTRRPGFPWSLLRTLGLLLVVGPGLVLTILLSGAASGAGHVLPGVAASVLAIVVSLVLNIGVFWLAFRLGTAREVGARSLLLGAVLAAIIWQILQYFGTYLVSHELKTNSAYGTFGVVLGLLAWFYIQAELTLYAVEINVVRVQRLWPRSMFPPPLTEHDRRAYELYALAEQRRPELAVVLRPADEEHGQPRTAGDGHRDGEPSGDPVAESAGTRQTERTEPGQRRGFRRAGGRHGR
jgi:membrane protein